MKPQSLKPSQFRRVGKYDNEPPAIKKILSMQDEVSYHLVRTNRTLDDEFKLILNSESTLPARLRQFILSWYEFQFNQQQLNQNEEFPQTENPDDVRSDISDELHPGDDSESI